MINDPHVLYKLIILYMLHQANLALSNDRLSDFFLSQEYTDYMTLQQDIGELKDAHLIRVSTVRGVDRYELTREGEESLSFFQDNLSESIKADVQSFLKDNRLRLRNEMGLLADYRKGFGTEYVAELRIREGKNELLNLAVSLPDEEQAKQICNRWKSISQEVYAGLMASLLQD